MAGCRRNWFEAIGHRLRAIVRRRVAEVAADHTDECEAVSDLTQEAMLTAAERLDDFRGTTEAQLIAWVCRIAESKVCDHRRAVRRKKCDLRRSRPLDAWSGELPDEVRGPDDAALLAEERERVRRLIDELPVIERKAVRLRYIDERSIAEVAEGLYRSEAAAQGVLKRALARLRSQARTSAAAERRAEV